jgi:catechol 2,3-dioxygenase-like lactoylglutathione lyase family enzyme
MALEHVNLTVADVERSAAFYSDLLGWSVRWKGEVGPGVPGAHVGDDTTYLALFQAVRPAEVDHDYGRIGVNHFGVVVDDLVAAKARLEELGVTRISWVDEYGPGRRLYFFDPDDYEVELVEY